MSKVLDRYPTGRLTFPAGGMNAGSWPVRRINLIAG